MSKLDKILARVFEEGKKYFSQYSLLEEAWNNCERGDWMLCLAFNMGISLQELTLAKGRIAKTVVHLMEDDRSKKAVEVAITFGKGKATIKELNAAKVAAYAAYIVANINVFDTYSQAKDAANQAANACVNFCKIYEVATYAARAVAVAADAYDIYDDAESAIKKSLQNSAEICRGVLTETVFKRLAELRKEEI